MRPDLKQRKPPLHIRDIGFNVLHIIVAIDFYSAGYVWTFTVSTESRPRSACNPEDYVRCSRNSASTLLKMYVKEL